MESIIYTVGSRVSRAGIWGGGEVAVKTGESEQVKWCGLPDRGIVEQAWWG
jgi:hypothetical protein